MKRRVSRAPIIFVGILVVMMFAILVFVYSKKKDLADHARVSFDFINLASGSCMLYGPGGHSIKEELISAGPSGTVIIPVGTTIVGDCFSFRATDKPYAIKSLPTKQNDESLK